MSGRNRSSSRERSKPMRQEHSRPGISSTLDFGISRFHWQAGPAGGRQLAFLSFLLKFFVMPERVQKPFDPAPWGPKQGDEGGPRSLTFPVQTPRTYSKKCARWTPTNRSATG